MEKGTTDITDIVFSENNEDKEEERVDAKVTEGNSDDSISAEAKIGGVFNSLISGILHPNGEGSAAADERERGGNTDGDGGGGLIDNLVSHLPDDAAPDMEEASMLIHSVVRD